MKYNMIYNMNITEYNMKYNNGELHEESDQ